jgi:hypothetical protein
MRYLALAVGLGAAGIIAAVAIVRAMGAGSGPVSIWWLVQGSVFPIFAVVYGPLLLTYWQSTRAKTRHRREKFRRTAEGAHWFPFVSLGAALAALGTYACSIELASLHSESGFWTLFMNPAEAPEVATWGRSQLGRYSLHTNAPSLFDLAFGGALGASGTYVLIWQAWD